MEYLLLILMTVVFLVFIITSRSLSRIDQAFRITTTVFEWTSLYSKYLTELYHHTITPLELYEKLPSIDKIIKSRKPLNLDLLFAPEEVQMEFKNQLKIKEKVLEWAEKHPNEEIRKAGKSIKKQFLLDAVNN